MTTFFRTPSIHSSRLLLHGFHINGVSSSLPLSRTLRCSPVAMASTTSQSSQTVESGDAGGGSDVFQLIQAHQAAAARLSPIEEARTLLDYSVRGVLSSFSKDHESYPSGSMVDFACDDNGSPILAVSSLAVHSKNLSCNPKCSLLVAKDFQDRTDVVITLHGDATPVSEKDREAVRSVYLRKLPDAFWVDFGDFQFIQIKPKFVRYVTGVATALLGSGEFGAEEFKAANVDPIFQFSSPIMSHMNKDHPEDTKAIVQYSTSVKVDSAYMLDVDSLGFNVKAGFQGSTLKLRIPFPRRAEDRKDVKTLIVEMLQAARASS
ncbi:FMN-binding split barrel-containing protein [Dioscorea alata]|uniref:FMN-binding split barrel-containing protein n=4 Tax=Dioscorea alata TaxID=55571 RepID=A0ACB7UMR6_DIOAL|nr:FMN-binding split barrel-containing protein [Dioscorea alata]KAH7661803.1 FMN-binding split barrel-containing protein [Dioscorea alata]KAH7661804.1 FMN-binding split barrel-containing protein [Dioscorea alata]KAH7661805.1 FMN-binding split barrel-containing protein [Dioscorea alata]